VCGLSADMKCRILTVWTLLEEVLRLSQEQQQWLESQEQMLKDMDSRRGQMSQDEIQDLISRVEVRIYNFLALSNRLSVMWLKSRPR
jgi:hypothetical protein